MWSCRTCPILSPFLLFRFSVVAASTAYSRISTLATPPVAILVSLSGDVLTNEPVIVPSDGLWHELSFVFTSYTTVPNATLTLAVPMDGYAGGILTLNATSLIPAISLPGGVRVDVADQVCFLMEFLYDVMSRALLHARFSCLQLSSLNFDGPLRFPGGCFAPFYD